MYISREQCLMYIYLDLSGERLMGPIMETILISLYATICCLGILSNTALIWVVLGKYLDIIQKNYKDAIKQTLKSSYSYLYMYSFRSVGNINFLTFSLRPPLQKREATKKNYQSKNC